MHLLSLYFSLHVHPHICRGNYAKCMSSIKAVHKRGLIAVQTDFELLDSKITSTKS